jgi:predicted ribosomally synthesized peptide with SipW-like signal peptide
LVALKNTIWLTLAALLIIGIVGGTTWAYYNDSETASGNSFQAWSADLWTQTSQADFEAGISYQVDTASNPGNVLLVESPNWYDTDWDYRKEITIDHTEVDADLTDFPVLISIPSDADLAAHAQTSGDDILFTSVSSTIKLSHEIESFNSTTGELVAWVKLPSLSSISDTGIYIYYGNPASGNQENVTEVWDDNFKMVQHLEETSGDHYDSTSNGNTGTPYGGVIQDATGRIDGADDLDGADDYVTATLGGLNAPFTIEAWGYFDSLNQGSGDYDYILMLGTGGNMVSISRNAAGANADRYYSWSQSAQRLGPVLPGQQWLHIVVVSDTSSPYHSMYLNGVPQTVDDFTSVVNTNGDLVWGEYAPASTHWLDGKVDEVRISNVARSAEWIKTCYNNQNLPSGFYSVGIEEGKPEVTPCNIASQVLDTGVAGATWNTLFWDETLPSNTDIILEVKASDVIFDAADAAPLWTIVGGTSPVASGLPPGRYKQWRARLTTSDTSNTPVLHEVRVYYF